MNRLLAACFLLAVLSGCGAQALVGPILSAAGGLGGSGSSATLTLQIDQAHGTLTMGNAPSLTMLPAPLPAPPLPTQPPIISNPSPGTPTPPVVPSPPTSGGPPATLP